MNNVSRLSLQKMETKAVIGVLGAVAVMGLGACSTGSTTQSTTPAGTGSNTAQPRSGHGNGIAGQITAENGSTWTLTSINGTQYTVDVTPQTQFGTTRAPGTAQQFPVGTTARVTGTINDHTITAARITAPRRQHPASTPSTPPTS